jgi:hypothetical protein
LCIKFCQAIDASAVVWCGVVRCGMGLFSCAALMRQQYQQAGSRNLTFFALLPFDGHFFSNFFNSVLSCCLLGHLQPQLSLLVDKHGLQYLRAKGCKP